MAVFFKGLALFVALTCLVWVGVLWQWQSTGREWSLEDALIYLVLLPITIFGLVLLARWAFKGAAAKTAAPVAAAASGSTASASAAPAAPASSADESARHATWQLLSAAVHTSVGTSVSDLLAAAEAQAPTPALDEELRNSEGLPVIAARVPDLSVDAVQEEIAPLVEQGQTRHPQLSVSDDFVRALALLEAPLAEALQPLAPWRAAFGVEPAPGTPSGASDAAPKEATHRARLRLLVAWPAHWNALELEVARMWIERPLREASADIVARRRWVMPPLPHETQSHAPLSGPQLWQQADALFEAMRREEQLDAVMLVATHSDLSSTAVERLDAAGRLFSSNHPKGRVPGEAAAVLVLAPSAWPADPDADAPKPHVHRAALMQRDKSIDAGGRMNHDKASALVKQALALARVEANDVAALTNDADQHSPRAAELFAAMLAVLPELDASEDMRMIGQLCGQIGACGTLLTVAMAAERARSLEKPCLAFSVSDTHWRCAVVARPSAPPPPASTPAPPPSAPAAKS